MKLLAFLTVASTLVASMPLEYAASEPAPPSPPTQFHEAPYKSGWDIDYSPYSGGENLLFVHRSLERFEGWRLEKSPIRYEKKGSAVFFRLCELLSVWLPLNDLAVVVQHEVFGHGYRIRDLGKSKAKVTGYQINAPIPYGEGGGGTSFGITEKFTTTDDTAVSMAGVEATAILAELARLHWLEAGAIDPRQTFLYLGALYDLPLYISTLSSMGNSDGHDMSAYVRSLNLTYTEGHLTASHLRSVAWINLADPFTYYALYAWGRYAACGKETRIPMIRFGTWKYLPSVRLGLTPFGPEVFLQNYLVQHRTPLSFYLKGGNHSGNTYLGVGCYAPRLVSQDRWSMGVRLDAWRQPKLLLQPAAISFAALHQGDVLESDFPLYSSAEQHSIRYGGAGSFLASYQGTSRSSFELELGYKAQGFLPGNALKAAPIARAYFVFVF